MSFFYVIVWLFHFKMSPNTTVYILVCRPSGYGVDLLLVPYSRVLSYRSVKRAQMQARGLHISQPTSIKSHVLLRSAVLDSRHTCFLCILHDRELVAIALESFEKKKSIH